MHQRHGRAPEEYHSGATTSSGAPTPSASMSRCAALRPVNMGEGAIGKIHAAGSSLGTAMVTRRPTTSANMTAGRPKAGPSRGGKAGARRSRCRTRRSAQSRPGRRRAPWRSAAGADDAGPGREDEVDGGTLVLTAERGVAQTPRRASSPSGPLRSGARDRGVSPGAMPVDNWRRARRARSPARRCRGSRASPPPDWGAGNLSYTPSAQIGGNHRSQLVEPGCHWPV